MRIAKVPRRLERICLKALAADDKGNITACWQSDKLYANVSHDDGGVGSESAFSG